MTLEEEIFKKTQIDFAKILKYGFNKENNLYKYSQNIMNNAFRVDVLINSEGSVSGKVYDLGMEEEYTNFRLKDATGAFIAQVREEFINVLIDICNKCFQRKLFLYDQANRIAEQIKLQYGTEPEFEWDKYPGFATFRNSVSKKWYCLIMNIDKSKIDTAASGEVEVMDIKLNPNKILELLKKEGYYPAYHMNKKSWITIILDNTIADEDIMNLIAESYSYTVPKNNNDNTKWLIPANPKYFDVEKALNESKTITWKQSTNMKVNDSVYLYVAEPCSSIMYKLKVIETNIPCNYENPNLKIRQVMKLELVIKYEKGKLSFKKLKEFGINAVRGPRYMPEELVQYIDKM